MKVRRVSTKNPLPEDYIVTYEEDGRYGFVYYETQGDHRIKYTGNIFQTEDEAEKEAYEWMFAQDTDDDDRRQIRYEMKHFFIEEASVH
jgi:hypothetical protein